MDKELDMRAEINEAVIKLGLKPEEFGLANLYKYEDILLSIIDRFTTLGKKGLSALWWWEHFKEPRFSMRSDYTPSLLMDLIPLEERIWFIAEDWHRTKKNGNFWLYEGNIKAVVSILEEMFGFEYYIVSKKLEWLVCENHHDYLIGVGQHIIDRMKQLKHNN